ncbi:MAG: ABC transporter ATP-binding protein [Chloroflexota bacterium]|nr:ABC transporter ATP-binding protein [Chloroflexota bacterium]
MKDLLIVKSVTKVFGGLIALNNVDMVLREGQILGLIGPNGAGKTTLFNCILSTFPVSSGRIYYRGKDITELKPPEIARLGISRTFQLLQLFGGMTVLDNVMIGAHVLGHAGAVAAVVNSRNTKKEEKKIRETALYYLDLLNLTDKRDLNVKLLSYGDQRRVEIARALASDPDLILLDEPAAGMNIRESIDLTEFILWIRNELKKSILIIEHNMRVIMPIADHIVVLNQGEKIFEGNKHNVQSSPEVVEAYLGKDYVQKMQME